jgi:hypothetical protein
MANRKSDLLDQFLVRMPTGMRDKIAEVARENMRTMNGQINYILKSALDRSKDDGARSE